LNLPRSSANPLVTSDRCALWNVRHLLVNTSVYMSVIMAGVSVYLSVIMAKYCNFFATLCEIPTGTRPSVIVAKCRNCFATLCEITTGISSSVIVAKCCNFFATLCEIPTGKISSVKLIIFLQVLFVLRVYASAQKIE
jgi:hypothetical protein